MSKHRSFALSDFSLRELPGAFVVYVILSAICVLAGLALESVPPFWRGLLSGLGLGLCGALLLLTLLHRRQEIDTTDLPGPSAEVRRICEDPNSTLAEAVKAYRDETGLGLVEGTAVLKAYLLYSVGPNMVDEGGRKDGKADDLAVTADGKIDDPEP